MSFPHITQSQARAAREELDVIKVELRAATRTYEQAKEDAKEPLRILNAYMKRRAQENGLRHKEVGFAGFMR